MVLAEILQVVTILSIVGGGGLVLIRVGAALKGFQQTAEGQAKEIAELKAEIKALGSIVTQQAVQSNRLDRLEADVREMKHLQGFVTDPQPIVASRRGGSGS